MTVFVCESCGGRDYSDESGYRICAFCGGKYKLDKEDLPQKESFIAIDDDIARLLKKIEKEPRNARKYANLILDIDPTNIEAKRILLGIR